MSQVTDYRKGVRAFSKAQWSKSLHHNQEKSPLFYEVRALWVDREIAARENMNAKLFKNKALNEGEAITLIRLRQVGIDQESHPIYEEVWTDVKGFYEKQSPTESSRQLGSIVGQQGTFLLPYDADVDEVDFEV